MTHPAETATSVPTRPHLKLIYIGVRSLVSVYKYPFPLRASVNYCGQHCLRCPSHIVTVRTDWYWVNAT